MTRFRYGIYLGNNLGTGTFKKGEIFGLFLLPTFLVNYCAQLNFNNLFQAAMGAKPIIVIPGANILTDFVLSEMGSGGGGGGGKKKKLIKY